MALAPKWQHGHSQRGMARARATLRIVLSLGLIAAPTILSAGGPRWVAGSSYFDPAAQGKPIVWRGGVLNYYTDQSYLSDTVHGPQADIMVANAAALWSSVPTAAVSIVAAGTLNEDVYGADFTSAVGVATAPADILSTATRTPLGIVYDYNGNVIDILLGNGASDPIACLTNGVIVMVDGMATDGTFNHALMILNGRCATNDKLAMMQYLITRAFGQVLGVDWSQANDGIFTSSYDPSTGAQGGWPLMHPVERLCSSSSGACMPETLSLRPDDIATLNRLYPVTPANIGNFSGKVLTAASTVSVRGTIRFRNGQGMQGVNVVLQPLKAGTNLPDPRYTATAVTGALFQGNAGNPVNGLLDPQGIALSRFGSTDAALEGAFDLSGVMLPPGATQSDYQLTFEGINALDTGKESVGPYALGQVQPSGDMQAIVLRGLQAGSNTTEDVTIEDSNQELGSGADGAESSPANLPGNGEWLAKLSGYGHGSWYRWHIRAGRLFTIESQALDEQGHVSADKARPVLGIWDGVDAPGAHPANPIVTTLQPFNGGQTGLTTIAVQTLIDADVRLGVVDQRGDGRPDFLYRGRVLYADSVTPQRIALAGAPITLRGTGFRPQDVVTVNGAVAAITSLSSTEIFAIAPPAGTGIKGSVDLVVTDPATLGYTTIVGGISYDAGNTDSIGVVTAPSNTVPMNVPLAFTTKTLAADGASPAGMITVTYAVTSGTAVLGCGQPSCSVVSSGDGLANMSVTANSTAIAVVTASLGNGASVQAHFTGGQVPQIAALSGTLYLAQGATLSWRPTALVLSGGAPSAGRTVTWTAASAGATVSAVTTVSDSQGHATGQILAGPLQAGSTVQVNACLPGGGSNCTAFLVASVDPAIDNLVAVSGTMQSLSASGTPDPVFLRVEDSAGHPIGGAVVNFYQVLLEWQPPCPLHGRCPAAPILANLTTQAVSGVDGLVSVTPLSTPGKATLLNVVAVTGGDTALSFQIEQHP